MNARAWFVLFFLPFFVPALTQAQEKPARTIAFEDFEVFCHILHHNKKQRLTAIRTVEELTHDPADTILILFGSLEHENVWKALNQIPAFQANGGAVLVATDKGLRNAHLPIRISGQPVRRSNGFGGADLCPWLARIHDEDAEEVCDRAHPIFHLVLKGIATNCPSYVSSTNDAAVRPLLSFPADAQWDIPGQGVRKHYIIGSARDAPPSGRVLYIAGHGIFMNGMLLQSTTDNFRFAVNVVDWLAETPHGKARTKALLIVDGTIVPDFDMKLTPPPPPVPIPPRAIINRLLRDLHEEDRIQQIFQDSIDQESTLAMGLSFLVGGLLLYGAKKLLESRKQIEPAAPRMVGKVATSALSATSLQSQQVATLRRANFHHETRQLVRAWFQQEFGVKPESWSADIDAQLRVRRYFWTLGITQVQADRVVRMARVAKDATVLQHEFLQTLRALQDLTTAARGGRVTLLIDGKNVRKPA
jgi:hypothetical protein